MNFHGNIYICKMDITYFTIINDNVNGDNRNFNCNYSHPHEEKCRKDEQGGE